MRSRLAVLLAALAAPAAAAPAVVAPAADSARAPGSPGLVLSARVGYALPYGEIARDVGPLEDVVGAKVPFSLELGYRFGPWVEGDIYLEFAPTDVAAACPSSFSCSASDVRFGLAVRLHARPSSRLDPWIAVGFGVEVVNASYVPDPAQGRSEFAWSGFELPVEGGVDLRLADRFTLGPFLHATFARFTSSSVRPPGGTTTSASIDDRDTHGWLQVGLKATLWL